MKLLAVALAGAVLAVAVQSMTANAHRSGCPTLVRFAQVRDAPASECLSTLVHSLAVQQQHTNMTIKQLKVELGTGATDKSSTQLRHLQIELANICRYNKLVSSFSETTFSGPPMIQTVNCY